MSPAARRRSTLPLLAHGTAPMMRTVGAITLMPTCGKNDITIWFVSGSKSGPVNDEVLDETSTDRNFRRRINRQRRMLQLLSFAYQQQQRYRRRQRRDVEFKSQELEA